LEDALKTLLANGERMNDSNAEVAGNGIEALLYLMTERCRVTSKCNILLKLVFNGLVYNICTMTNC
jgi:hypothetical protein